MTIMPMTTMTLTMVMVQVNTAQLAMVFITTTTIIIQTVGASPTATSITVHTDTHGSAFTILPLTTVAIHTGLAGLAGVHLDTGHPTTMGTVILVGALGALV